MCFQVRGKEALAMLLHIGSSEDQLHMSEIKAFFLFYVVKNVLELLPLTGYLNKKKCSSLLLLFFLLT